MTIDLKRLAVDLDYWDEVAPEGATHFMYSEKFVKWVDGVELSFYVSSERKWKKSFCSWSFQQYIDCGNYMIAKPTKPAAQEWDGTGLPPVGADQTVFVPFMAMSLRASANTESTWSVIAHHSGMAVVVINECGQGKLTVVILSEKECRPVVSQAERERKELATFLEDYHLEMGSYWCPEKEADYILSSYDVAKKARGESE
jgi:hypothetical protein